MDQDLTILTPEKTILSYRLAGLGSRVSAHIIDLIILILTIYLVAELASITLGFVDRGLAFGILMTFIGAAPFLYFILFEGLWNGQTLGKRMAGIRVRMVDGTPISFVAALGRNLIRPADMLPGPYFLGLLAIFTNPRSQRIGDQVAGTVVCYERRSLALYSTAPHVAGIHPMESSVGELIGMTAPEYDALKRMCDRFPEFPVAVQKKMIQEIWLPISQRRHVPDVPNVNPLFLAEAAVMKYGRRHGLL